MPAPRFRKPLEGTFNEVSTANAQQGGAPGAKVRWGGEIIKTEPGPQQTCFFVLSEPLDNQARPTGGHDGQTQGRFVACRDGFYDPEVFTRGREITVTGTVHGAVSQKVGDFDYAYPRVEADVVYLWPKRWSIAIRRATTTRSGVRAGVRTDTAPGATVTAASAPTGAARGA